MGPTRFCSLCNGLHPEGLHFTVRGALAPEPAPTPVAPEPESTSLAALGAERDPGPTPPFSPRAELPR